MPTGALPRLKASLVIGVILWSVLALAEAHADKSVSFFDGIVRRRSQNDCQEVGSPCWIGSLAAKEEIKAEERAMDTRRSQFAEAMRSANEKLGKTLHGDRLRKVAAKTGINTAVNTAVDELARLDKNGNRRVGTAVDVLARPDKNIRSVQEERMRKVWQKGSFKPANRRQLGGSPSQPSVSPPSPSSPSPDTCDGAIEVKTFIDRCVVLLCACIRMVSSMGGARCICISDGLCKHLGCVLRWHVCVHELVSVGSCFQVPSVSDPCLLSSHTALARTPGRR